MVFVCVHNNNIVLGSNSTSDLNPIYVLSCLDVCFCYFNYNANDRRALCFKLTYLDKHNHTS